MFAEIAIDVPLRMTFTYRIPDDFLADLRPYSWVRIPFGRKKVAGLVVKISEKAPHIPLEKLKDITEPLPNHPKLAKSYWDWLNFAADYYNAPLGQVISQAIPSYYFEIKKRDKPPRCQVLKFGEGFLTKTAKLTPKQNEIFQAINDHKTAFYPALLHGITGSGKTEIYIKLIKEVLTRGESALFLVPEIGLTPQMLARLNHHFENQLLVYHSGLTQNQKLFQWQQGLQDKPQVMVGTRSALFTPFEKLGLIIIDEEHDTSYKQEDRFRYHARDLAISRAQHLKIPIVLGSATPSLESYHLAQEGKYQYFELNERVGGAKLPEIRVIDYAKEQEQTKANFLVSQNIHQAIDHFYEKREQMILFVGQRGYAQNAYCLKCSTIQTCPNCAVGLKHHKHNNLLKCHYCDYEKSFDEICLNCKEKALTLLGFGTQSVEEEIKEMHPSLIIQRLDSDSISTPKQMHQIFSEFSKGKINMLIGTQMLAKGHDFGNVGFVGILGIDAHLGLPEFRASERSFQNLVQVAGRSGRSDKSGHVIVQSLMPEQPAIALGIEQDYKNFANMELASRKALNYPPYSRLIQFRFLGNHEKQLEDFLATWSVLLEHVKKTTSPQDLQILGPTPMPLSKVRGKFRYHVLIKLRRGLNHNSLVQYLLKDLDARKLTGIQYQLDIDAQSLV